MLPGLELLNSHLNYMGDATRLSLSSRRTSPLQQVNGVLQTLFRKNCLKNIDEFYGVVVNEVQRTNPSADCLATQITPADNPDQTLAPYSTYQVYIPELECRPMPLSYSDPVIYTYKEYCISSSLLMSPGAGSIVIVKFNHPSDLERGLIVGVEGAIDGGTFGTLREGLSGTFANGNSKSMTAAPGVNTTTTQGEQEIPLEWISNIRKSNNNPESNSYTHWGNNPKMPKLLQALNEGAKSAGVYLTVNSALRTPYNQGRIMLNNFKQYGGSAAGGKFGGTKGGDYLRDLYGRDKPPGKNKMDSVIAIYESDLTREEKLKQVTPLLTPGTGKPGKVSPHQPGQALDIKWAATTDGSVAKRSESTPPPAVTQAIAHAITLAAIKVLLEKDHYHISYLGATGRPRVTYFGKSTQSQRTAAKAGGLDNKKTYPKVTTAQPGPTDSATTTAASADEKKSEELSVAEQNALADAALAAEVAAAEAEFAAKTDHDGEG